MLAACRSPNSFRERSAVVRLEGGDASVCFAQGSDGERDLLEIQPSSTHERLPVFLGSWEDIAELESYGDVQQTSKKTYNV